LSPTVGRADHHGNRRGAPVGDPGKWWFGPSPAGKEERVPAGRAGCVRRDRPRGGWREGVHV